MAIIVNSIITSLTEDRQEAIRKAVGILEVPEPLVQSAYIAKTSLDARRRGDIRFVHSVSVTLADGDCLLYTSPSPRDRQKSRMPSSA